MKRTNEKLCLGYLMFELSKLASLLMFAISIIFASHASAYQVITYMGKEVKWKDLDIPVEYYINQNGTPDCTDEFTAIQKAYQTWENVPSAYMDFNYGGTTANSNWGANDGVNLNIWIESDWANVTGTNSSTIAVNRIWFYVWENYCYLLDSDIAYNDENFTWSSMGEPGKMDIQNIATHETGHSLSLDDLYGGGDSEKTMYCYSAYGEIKKRTLHQDDEAGISYIYPVAADVTPPTIETIYELQHKYYNYAPSFSNFGFDDETALDDGWYQMDSYTGTWTSLFTDIAGKSWDCDGWTVPEFNDLTEGSHTIYFKASDDSGNVEGELGEWGWQFYKDITPPEIPAITSLTHPCETTWYNSNDIIFSWTTSSDLSGIKGYSYLLDQNFTTMPDTIKDNIDTSKSYIGIADGVWYFHCRAQDNASNWGMPGHRKILIDIEEPTLPALLYPNSGCFIYDTLVNLVWQASTDIFSGVNFYLLEHADNCDFLNANAVEVYDTTYVASFTDTTYYWRVKAVDAATNESDWSATSYFTVKTGCDISGNLSYYSNDLPVENATILLVDDAIDTVYSDVNGNYIFSNLPHGLNYAVYPTKTNKDKDTAVTPFDASYALRFCAGLIDLDPYQRLAADVTGNGQITAFDASYIMRYYVGLIDSFPVGKDWTFVPTNFHIDTTNWVTAPASIFYQALSDDQFDQDYKGVLYGDVTGNWTNSKSLAMKGSKERQELPLETKRTDSLIMSRNFITLPIEITGNTEFYSVGITIKYDSKVLEIIEISKTQLTKDYLINYNVNGNTIRIALAGTKPILSGTLAEVKFRSINNAKLNFDNHIVIKDLQIDEKLIDEKKSIKFTRTKSCLTPYPVAQNYPNPFSNQTVISLQIPVFNSQFPITIAIYDLSGRLVRTLISEKQQSTRHYKIIWDGKDEFGKPLTDGVYFCKMGVSTNSGRDSYAYLNKIILLRR